MRLIQQLYVVQNDRSFEINIFIYKNIVILGINTYINYINNKILI